MIPQLYTVQSKPRFEVFEGHRGIAALIVVAFHFFGTYASGPGHSYPAVDFFLVLSGFTISNAYDDRR